MKIICNKNDLMNGLNIVLKAVSNKSTMSILQCVLFDCTRGDIRLITNDTELGIETVVPGTILEKGVVAYDANQISNYVRSLPDNDITIYSDADLNTLISCEKIKFTITGKNGDEFTYLPKIERTEGIYLSKISLKDLIRQTIFSIADNDTNKMMKGEMFEINGDILRVVSLDGHRISCRKINLKNSYEYRKVIIPGKTLNEISKIISNNDDEDVVIYLSNNHVLFEFDETIVVSRLIEGDYFDIDKMLSANFDISVKVNKKNFLDCISRATLLVKEGDKKPVIVDINDESINLRVNSAIGSMHEELDCEKKGQDIKIGFNPKFLIDALKVIDDEEIVIHMVNSRTPCIIKDEEENYIYLVLPINFV